MKTAKGVKSFDKDFSLKEQPVSSDGLIKGSKANLIK